MNKKNIVFLLTALVFCLGSNDVAFSQNKEKELYPLMFEGELALNLELTEDFEKNDRDDNAVFVCPSAVKFVFNPQTSWPKPEFKTKISVLKKQNIVKFKGKYLFEITFDNSMENLLDFKFHAKRRLFSLYIELNLEHP